MRFKRTGYLWALLVLMPISGALVAQQKPDSASKLEVLTSGAVPAFPTRSRSIVTPSGPGGFSRERLNLGDAIIVSEDFEELNQKMAVEERHQILFQLALHDAGLNVSGTR